MELIKFDDTCKVFRDNGEYDEWSIPLKREQIYSGKCRYQQGVQAYMGISQRNSVLFLDGDVRLSENDSIEVVLSNGVERGGVVKTVRNVEMPLTHKRLTRIEIIQDTESKEE